MPTDYERKWQTVISLDPQAVRDGSGPIATDESFVIEWTKAINELLDDADAELPAG